MATLALFGIFILAVYLICQMVKGAGEITTEIPVPEDQNESFALDALDEGEQAMTNS